MPPLADDLTDYVAVPTPIEDIPAGAECDLGTGWLELIRDTDTRPGEAVLIYEDDGQRMEYAAAKGSGVDQYVRVPRVEGQSEVDRYAIALMAVSAPPLTRTQIALLERDLAPGVRAEIAKRTREAA